MRKDRLFVRMACTRMDYDPIAALKFMRASYQLLESQEKNLLEEQQVFIQIKFARAKLPLPEDERHFATI